MSAPASAAISLNTGSASRDLRSISAARLSSSGVAMRLTGLSGVLSFFTLAASASNTSPAARPNSVPRAVDTTSPSPALMSSSPASNQSVLGL